MSKFIVLSSAVFSAHAQESSDDSDDFTAQGNGDNCIKTYRRQQYPTCYTPQMDWRDFNDGTNNPGKTIDIKFGKGNRFLFWDDGHTPANGVYQMKIDGQIQYSPQGKSVWKASSNKQIECSIHDALKALVHGGDATFDPALKEFIALVNKLYPFC